ncbi:MAG: cytidylate kinase-like family protein [Magnetococcales bacterium]|nr:cytidylate kinase-like family protein [Magnetococcales bacterium]
MPGQTTKPSTTDDLVGSNGGENTKPLVTISGQHGAGAHEVGAALAEKLGVGLFDYRVLDNIVTKVNDDQNIKSWLDRQKGALHANWMKSFTYKSGKDMTSYLPYLVRTIMAIVPNGGVIIGHGAHLILVDANVLRLKVESGPKVCAQRIAAKHGITIKAAGKLSAKVNKERISLVQDVYDHFPTEKTYYDLSLSSEILSVDQIVKITIAAMKEANLPVR